MWRTLSWIPVANDPDAFARTWGVNRGKWMWGRICRWEGAMGIFPRVRVPRRAILGLDQQ